MSKAKLVIIIEIEGADPTLDDPEEIAESVVAEWYSALSDTFQVEERRPVALVGSEWEGSATLQAILRLEGLVT